MNCLICKNLERALESRRSEYLEARSSPYYQVTTEFAAIRMSIRSAPKATWKSNWYAFPPQNETVSFCEATWIRERQAGRLHATSAQPPVFPGRTESTLIATPDASRFHQQVIGIWLVPSASRSRSLAGSPWQLFRAVPVARSAAAVGSGQQTIRVKGS